MPRLADLPPRAGGLIMGRRAQLPNSADFLAPKRSWRRVLSMAKSQRNVPPPAERVTRLLQLARDGSRGALGQLLNAYRPFLLAIATEQLDSELKAKAGPSDAVQETFLDAQHAFDKFKSDTETEFRVWLHAILMNNLADLRKRYFKAAKRQVRRERHLSTDDSRQLLRQLAEREGQSPSRTAISREEEQRINTALDGLPPAYKQIILMRSQQRQTFAEIGAAIGKSADAARMLWQRAVARLQRELKD
jgi:RNA polymerase sigma-70 factor (ECF subfamily)